MLRKLLHTALAAFLGYQAWSLLRLVPAMGSYAVGVQLLLAFVYNLLILGAFAFVGFAWPTWRVLPKGYYRVSAPKQLRAWYDRLGVGAFRKALLATFWRSDEQRAKHFDGTRAGLQQLDEASKRAEFGHLIPFVVLSGVAIWGSLEGGLVFGVATLSLNIVANLYPVLLQRHHRLRLQRMAAIRARRGH